MLDGAAITLSATTFRTGDFIHCGDHFGRVSERGLMHTEIQTEERCLTTLPNLYLVTHAVTKVRDSGTIVAATVSLGYDVPRVEIERLLLEAATSAELKDPFVQIRELGDFFMNQRVFAENQEFIPRRTFDPRPAEPSAAREAKAAESD